MPTPRAKNIGRDSKVESDPPEGAVDRATENVGDDVRRDGAVVRGDETGPGRRATRSIACEAKTSGCDAN
jgi:hypothetical protein